MVNEMAPGRTVGHTVKQNAGKPGLLKIFGPTAAVVVLGLLWLALAGGGSQANDPVAQGAKSGPPSSISFISLMNPSAVVQVPAAPTNQAWSSTGSGDNVVVLALASAVALLLTALTLWVAGGRKFPSWPELGGKRLRLPEPIRPGSPV